MDKSSSLLDSIRGESMDKYIGRLLSLQSDFGIRFDSPYIYSQKTLNELTEYYYNSFVNPMKNKKNNIFPIERLNIDETFYGKVPFSMSAGTVFVRTGDLIRDLMIEQGFVCNPEHYEFLPILAERLTYEDLAKKTGEEELKIQGIAYQINRARSFAETLDLITELKRDYKPEIQRLANHSKMIIVSTALASAFNTKEIDKNFSKKIRRIISNKESLDGLFFDCGLSYDDCRIEIEASHQIQTLKMNSSRFY